MDTKKKIPRRKNKTVTEVDKTSVDASTLWKVTSDWTPIEKKKVPYKECSQHK